MVEEQYNYIIGKNIKKLRIKHGLKQNELAEELHITVSSLSHYENGVRMPTIELLIKIEELLSEDIHLIIGDDFHQ